MDFGGYRPRSSEAGPAIRGPTAKARTNTETRRERIVTFVSWNSIPTCVTAGACYQPKTEIKRRIPGLRKRMERERRRV